MIFMIISFKLSNHVKRDTFLSVILVELVSLVDGK